jgi:hypothetical protein
MVGLVTFDGISPNGQPTDHYPPTAQIVADLKGAVVGLATPDDTVAPGRYGIYSDGAQHIEAVAVTAAGRRLFLDLNGDTVSSNVLGQINSLNF